MARYEHHIDASAAAVFDVLADPRGYAYWVLGSREVRDSDPNWPAVGSRFHHTVGAGPLRAKDHTVVESVEPGRFIQLQAKARPFGKARVKLELEPADGGTRVTMIEDPADTASAFLFMPLTHLLARARNARSLERLAELAEGRRPMPGEEPGAPVRSEQGEGAVENPWLRERPGPLPALGRGAVAGLAGAAAMSVSTNVEMRLRGRPPSDAPAKALARVLGIRATTERRQKLAGAAGHVATAVSLGAVSGLLVRLAPRPGRRGVALFALAMTPELVVVPALGATEPPWRWSRAEAAISVLHHAVFAAATTAAYEALGARS